MNIYMEKAKQNADNGIKNKEGGPFGAIITDKEGNIISNGNNKVIKNNDTLDNNFILSKNYIKELIDLFPNYNENKNINIFIKKFVIKISDDDKELKKYIRKFSKKNYINLYFKYLSVKNKYSIKNPLD